MTFHDLTLIPPLLRAVEKAGYTTPSPIQQKAIRPVLAGRDLLGCAQTGTGKTAAFALPILQRLASSRPAHRQVRALVLTPTRELALQIDESFAEYGRYLPLRHAVVFGGVGQAPQVAALEHGVDILVACPGRLNDLIGQGFADLGGVEIFVLDEADRMLDMGFVNDVKKVIRHLPQKRQTLLFSATMPEEIEQLAASILHDAVEVKADPVSSTVDKIEQSLYYVSKGDKPALLARLVGQPSVKNALVFSRTKHGADRIARILNKAGVPAAAIHGNKSQNARVAALESFKAGRVKALVATDIAARGIDISELSHVFNYDLPEVAETYVHRIGRTARAGQSGYAVSFCSPEEQEYLAGIEKLNRKKIPVAGGTPVSAAAAKQAVAEAAQAKAEALRARIASRQHAGGRRAQPAQPSPAASPAQPAGLPQSARAEKAAARPAAASPVPPKQQKESSAAPARAAKPAEQPQASARAKTGVGQGAGPQRAKKQPAAAPEAYHGPKPFWMPEQNPTRKEEPSVEQNHTKSGEGLSASAKRRRRRRAAANPAAPAQPVQARPPRQEKARAAAGSAQASRPEKGRAARPAAEAAGQQPPAQKQPARPARERSGPEKRASAREEDPGLLLIARRPPQQKFASFEEYMKSHGGASLPIDGQDEGED